MTARRRTSDSGVARAGSFSEYTIPVSDGMVVLDAVLEGQAKQAPTWRPGKNARRAAAILRAR